MINYNIGIKLTKNSENLYVNMMIEQISMLVMKSKEENWQRLLSMQLMIEE